MLLNIKPPAETTLPEIPVEETNLILEGGIHKVVTDFFNTLPIFEIFSVILKIRMIPSIQNMINRVLG
jgi:hypothetical protein